MTRSTLVPRRSSPASPAVCFCNAPSGNIIDAMIPIQTQLNWTVPTLSLSLFPPPLSLSLSLHGKTFFLRCDAFTRENRIHRASLASRFNPPKTITTVTVSNFLIRSFVNYSPMIIALRAIVARVSTRSRSRLFDRRVRRFILWRWKTRVDGRLKKKNCDFPKVETRSPTCAHLARSISVAATAGFRRKSRNSLATIRRESRRRYGFRMY